MITQASLKSQTAKNLTQLAKEKGVPGYYSMRKDDLIKALLKLTKKKATKPAESTKKTPAKRVTVHAKAEAAPKPKSNRGRKPKQKEPTVQNPRIARKIRREIEERERLRDLARSNSQADSGSAKDRLVLMVRDPFWLHAHWQISRQAIDRVKVAMAENWHAATPVLRVYLIESSTTTSTSESVERDIEIHGGVSNWYIDVAQSPKTFRVCIGYKTANGKFFPVARSNKVTTPRPGANNENDENWSDLAANCEKVYALSGGYHEDDSIQEVREVLEERLQRPIGNANSNRFGSGAESAMPNQSRFQFEVDAEMVVFGATDPNSRVTVAGEPVSLREDGSFAVRLSMPDKRQVLPIVASSEDGIRQKTTVLAIERNTKTMEPFLHDHESV
ncbi:DUF4912 domain-containing protein [Pirellulaceae bacterium]|nr:DUF4912 domain-containing protein [Pirellulaceae bacterium]MDB4640140.1 DUF4912 domain-containing protein [Pirellulaceae bacterium]